MACTKCLAFVAIVFFSNLSPVQSDEETNKYKENGLNKLLDNVIGELPRKDTNKFFSQMFKNENKINHENPKKKRLTRLPAREELPTKKSTEAFPEPEDSPAISVALAKPSVYLVNLESNSQIEESKEQKSNSEKRFKIPDSGPLLKSKIEDTTLKKSNAEERFNIPESGQLLRHDNILCTHPIDEVEPFKEAVEGRAKRQLRLNEGLPILRSIPVNANGVQTLPVQTLNTLVPAQNRIGAEGLRSDVDGINSNKVVTLVPVKVETPIRMAATASVVSMVSQTPQEMQPTVIGTSRSALPVTTLIQTSPDISSRTPSILNSPNAGNLIVRLADQPNRFTTTEQQDSGLKLTPEEGNAFVKLAQVPLNFLEQKKQNSNDIESQTKHSDRETEAVKLDNLSIKPLKFKAKDTEKGEAKFRRKTENPKKDINKETLKTLQSRLTNIISKLEAKVNKKEGQFKQKKNETSLSKIAKNKPSEKSLKFLKKRLSNVLEKFNSKPGAGQPFTIGKEWANVLKGAGASDGNQAIKVAGLMKKGNTTEKEGNWPSIASQLLRKLNKALIKLQEQKAARSLGNEAVMYFSFDKPKLTINDKNSLVDDKSGHFNDASVSGRAHTSSRTYGSCGKALILNSGNLRFIDKNFKMKPTKAITLAMWVRTNVTGYVKWFARDSGSSREFNTHTQYPLVHKNVWTHLCGTFNSSTGITRIYVDGELKAEKVNRQQESIPADFTPAGIGPAFGDLSLIAVDEVYMFARALDPSEARTLYDDCEFNRMVLHYGFQKINRTAGLVFDQSGLHNDGHLQGDARILDSGCEKCGSCLDLNADGDARLTVQASHFKHRPTKAVSIGAWFNLNSTSGTHPLFTVTESIYKSPLLDLLVMDGKLQWQGYNKDKNVIFNMETTQAVVPEGIWVHILATFDSLHGKAKIFIDGHKKAVEETAKKDPIGGDWSAIKIGGHDSGTQASGGYVDEFVLYNWELEPSEISYIMKYCPDHPKLVSFTVHVPLD